MKKIEIYCKINSNRMDRKNYAPYAFFLSKCQDFKYFFIIDRIKINVHCIINNKKSVHLIDKRHSQHIFFFLQSNIPPRTTLSDMFNLVFQAKNTKITADSIPEF